MRGALLLLAFLVGETQGLHSGADAITSGNKVELDKLYQKTGLMPGSAGRSCGELLSMGVDLPPARVHRLRAIIHAVSMCTLAFHANPNAFHIATQPPVTS